MEFGERLRELTESLRNRMDALIVCLSHAWGGLEQVAAHDTLDVGRLGLRVRLLCLHDTPIHRYLQSTPEVELVPIHSRPRNYFDFKFRSELLGLVHGGVNLIHTHQPSLLGSITPWFWGRSSRVAILATRHILCDHNKKNFFHQAIYSRLDSMMVISQALRKNVLETHPIKEPHVRVVNLGLDFNVFDPSRSNPEKQRKKWGLRSDDVTIGLVGRIDPAKGQDTFIKAAAGLLKKKSGNEKLKFLIIGEETVGASQNYLGKLKEMVFQFGLEEHVTFTGFEDHIPDVMSALDILVMPSREEAFGLVAIEAMAMECAVVVSDNGSADEIVGNEEFGLKVRPDDAYDLQRQLRSLLDSAERRIEMGKRARECVMNRYDRRIRLLKMLEVYERAMRRRKF